MAVTPNYDPDKETIQNLQLQLKSKTKIQIS